MGAAHLGDTGVAVGGVRVRHGVSCVGPRALSRERRMPVDVRNIAQSEVQASGRPDQSGSDLNWFSGASVEATGTTSKPVPAGGGLRTSRASSDGVISSTGV